MKLSFKFKKDTAEENGSAKEPKPEKAAKVRKPASGEPGALQTFFNNPMIYIILGPFIMGVMGFLLFSGSSEERDIQKALEQGQRAVTETQAPVKALQRVLQDGQIQKMALQALGDETAYEALKQHLLSRMREIQDLRLLMPNDYLKRTSELGDNAWILIDMMMTARTADITPVQTLQIDDGLQLAAMVALKAPEAEEGEQTASAKILATARDSSEEVEGYLLITSSMAPLLDAFNMTMPLGGYIGLEQSNGRYAPEVLAHYGDPGLSKSVNRLSVPGSMFRVTVPTGGSPSTFSGAQRLLFFLLGALILAFGLIHRRMLLRPVEALEADPERLAADEATGAELADTDASALDETFDEAAPEAVEEEPQPAAPEVELKDLTFDPEERRRNLQPQAAPVELSRSIFRAYDIRGIVGESLDADIALQVGQAIGTEALAVEATPVVVGRDGRHSGPDLVAGMIKGIASTGCDVVDVGAVPTGVLYYAAHEAGSGSGVMVTGSHNPPDYNGFKVMLGGSTLSGERITALYERIANGDLRFGKGEVSQKEMLEAYRERIASDIQLKRPLKVVADCGNGIGGICAADVLRAIGAEVLPLFDEVDGDFPNHHPDPSDPENLKDLIESVNLMKADLGVAFDGDADRLGVVTASGEIIYSDRLMMLFSREVLSRNPGANIIYDVKCTGKLDAIIRAAGGEPEMFKTGHSLIKNRMKEVDAPFAGEMSGHFFFKDRWYGFDCGIYSAARLLEILAMDERTPEQVLNSLPNSISTPELKVHMKEGENHAFVELFQEKARFADARVSTIDGLRADFEYGWGLVRASNTTPILVVRFEADSEESLEIIKESFRMQMMALASNLKLPF